MMFSTIFLPLLTSSDIGGTKESFVELKYDCLIFNYLAESVRGCIYFRFIGMPLGMTLIAGRDTVISERGD